MCRQEASQEIILPYFSDYKTHFPSQIWEENGGASYSLNVAYLACYRMSALKDVIKYFTTFFLLQKFFPYFPVKPWCVLWSEKNGIFYSKTVFSKTIELYL